MCTVTYIPSEEGYYLTSNRDEDPNRKTLPPMEVLLENGDAVTSPVDEVHKGTWIATSKEGKMACILNGGFEKHHHQPPYRKSRGQFVYEAFLYDSFSDFAEIVDLNNIEPFTLILIDEQLQVLVWDGNKKHILPLDKKEAYIWSSSTLYNKEQRAFKEKIFRNFLADDNIHEDGILKLHGLYEKNPFILDLPQVKTVSITQVVMKTGKAQLKYHSKNKKDEQINVLH